MSIKLSNSAIERIKEIKQKESNHDKFLRISISGGGCSGFQYLFDLDNKTKKEDVAIYEEDGKLIANTDETSLQFLDGCEIEFVRELGSSYFKVNNPNAKSSCGCGSSFSV
jgi:iron-sulfur cluster assembly accessory protein